MTGPGFKWEELPERAARLSLTPIGIRGVRIETVEAPIRGWQRLLLKLSRLATPKLHYIEMDLDLSRFPFGVERNDVYENRKGQRYVVTNFSEKGNRIKLKLIEPSPAPQVFFNGDWRYMFHAQNIAEKCFDDFKRKRVKL